MEICSFEGCQTPATRVVDGKPYCRWHRYPAEAPPVACTVAGCSRPAIPGRFGLCAFHLDDHPPAAA